MGLVDTAFMGADLAGLAATKPARNVVKYAATEMVPGIIEDLGRAAVESAPHISMPAVGKAKQALQYLGKEVPNMPDKVPKNLVPVGKPSLTKQGLEPDIVTSMTTSPAPGPSVKPSEADPAYVRIDTPKGPKKYVPREEIKRRKERRAELRQEAPTTPGPEAPLEQWQAWGDQYGVDMSIRPNVSLGVKDISTGRDIAVPGGLEGRFTIPELFEMKAHNFNPESLPDELHTKFMEKMLRTYVPETGVDEVDVYNALNFALTSPNAPLTPNEFIAARTRVGSMDELRDLANRLDEPGLEQNLRKEAGVEKAGRGGLGVLGTAKLSNQAAMAHMIVNNPEMFKPGPGETIQDVAFRVMNQVKGLGPKTSHLAVPWLDLAKGNTAAVDLHMIEQSYPRMLKDTDEVGQNFRTRMADLMGVPEQNLDDFVEKNPRKAKEAAIRIIGGSDVQQAYRAPNGELLAGADPRVAPERLSHEPKEIFNLNQYYRRVLDYINESRGENPKLALFPEQWRLWDRKRQRFEPHEMMHPDWRKLPKQSWSEMHAAKKAHADLGYLGKGPITKEGDWRSLYYGQADPLLLAAMGGGGLGAVALYPEMIQMLEEKRRESQP
jgi:hypothetical protein